MPAAIDITGQRFGRLTAIKRTGTRSGHSLWLCECDCGNTVEVSANSLKRGRTRSCGCLSDEERAKRAKAAGKARGLQLRKHGGSGTRLYNVWKSMRQRCGNPKDTSYKDYGGRGIGICEAWSDYSAFRDWAMSHGYDPDASFGECTIDRIDVNGNYEPSNCQWVDEKAQANNRRPRKKVVA